MSVDLGLILIFILAIGFLAIDIFFGDEIFPNALITWSPRIISLFIIIGLTSSFRRKRVRNL